MELTREEEIERAIRLLRTAMRLLGFTNREIERRLSYTPSYLTRLFSGQIELRFEHIVDIVQAMGMTVEEFFQFAYPARGGELSEAARKLQAMLEEMRPTLPPAENPALREIEFERTLVGALEKVRSKQQEQERVGLLELLEKVNELQQEYRDIARTLKREERRLRPKSEKARSTRKKPAA